MPVPIAQDETAARIDKWLWAVRIFKMRGPATEACKAGHVTIGDLAIKPAREIRAGDRVQVRQGLVTRTLVVVGIPRSRVGAKLVPLYCTDLTSPEEWEKGRKDPIQNILARPRGAGRPTKRERRELDHLFDPDS